MTEEKSKVNYWDIFILLLSLYVIFELAIEVIYPFSDNTLSILGYVDIGICSIFIIDFIYGFIKSKDKKEYSKKRWIDLVASIPFVGFLRLFRLARIVRIVRGIRIVKLIRGAKGLSKIFNHLSKNKLESILLIYVVALLIILFYCSLAFFVYEKPTNEMVNTFFDAVWLSFITITSVGFGDVYPVTTAGRIIAVILTLLGMGLFSLITAELSVKFISLLKKQNNKEE